LFGQSPSPVARQPAVPAPDLYDIRTVLLIIQNLAPRRMVFEFSARNVGPKV
jgi:hypothetical protein